MMILNICLFVVRWTSLVLFLSLTTPQTAPGHMAVGVYISNEAKSETSRPSTSSSKKVTAAIEASTIYIYIYIYTYIYIYLHIYIEIYIYTKIVTRKLREAKPESAFSRRFRHVWGSCSQHSTGTPSREAPPGLGCSPYDTCQPRRSCWAILIYDI